MSVLQRAVQGNKVPGFISGLILANNATDAVNDIDIAAGSAADDNGYIMNLASGITKRLDASWTVGTGNGGLDTGTIANSTYHVWLIQRSDTGVTDVLYSTSATSPTMPTNYDRKRRIGSLLRLSSAIIPFVQDGDDFMLKVPRADLSVVPTTSTVLRSLSVPNGIRVKALISVWYFGLATATASGTCYISDISVTDSVSSGALFNVAGLIISSNFSGGSLLEIMTNVSGQIRTNCSYSDANTTLRINTLGWTDTRGK